MQTKYFFRTFALLAFIFFILPAQSQAYGVTNTSVTKLSETTTMYTISYEFGFLNADFWMPIAASQNTDGKQVGYKVGGAKANAIVLSTADIDGNMYFVPKGKKATFTLLVLEETSSQTSSASRSVDISSLPHFIQPEGKERTLRNLSAEDLKSFSTTNSK